MFRIILLHFCFVFVSADLYNSSDPLVILDNKNLDENLLGSKYGWIIEFYSSWCGHCIHYAPTWRNFSNEVKDWDHTFKVGAIDCSDDENVEVCRDHEIMSYPSIKMFGSFTKKGEMGVKLTKRGVQEIQDEIISFIIEKETQNAGSKSWKNLLKYNGLLADIFKNASSDVKHAVLIVEKGDSKLGAHSILDLGNYPKVYIRRIDADNQEILNLRLSSVPAVILLSRNGKRQILSDKITISAQITSLIKEKLRLDSKVGAGVNYVELIDGIGLNPMIEKDGLGAGDVNPEEINSDRLNYDNDLPDTAFNSNGIQVYMVDIENAISYALRHEVKLHKIISGEALVSLKRFLDVLIKHLPTRSQVHDYLEKLKSFVEKSGKTLSAAEYEKALNLAYSPSSVLPDHQPWKGCLGSTETFRGYPCGLWTLFHSITVNADLALEEEKTLKIYDTLEAIHGYVKFFFSCEYCSKHFQEMYNTRVDTIGQGQKKDLLWLWDAHNKVNKRLHGQPSEDPKHIKIQFPSKYECPFCWSQGGVPNQKEVVWYLKKIYGRGSLSLEGTQTLDSNSDSKHNRQSLVFDSLGKNFANKENNSMSKIPVGANSWLYSGADVSLCVLLYVFSTVIIVAGYIMFILRRKLRRKKFIDMYKMP